MEQKVNELKAHTICFPCLRSGKMMRGFCPTVIDSNETLTSTLIGYIRFAEKFGIKYYCLQTGSDCKVIKLR